MQRSLGTNAIRLPGSDRTLHEDFRRPRGAQI